jgi:cytochrome b561
MTGTISEAAGLRNGDRYGTVAMALHWLTALGILTLIVLGLAMTRMPPGSLRQFSWYQLHKSVGITVLVLTLLRVAWRLGHRPPPLPPGMAAVERLAARGTHLAFYLLLLGMPLTGWALVSASPFNLPTVLYGVLPLPHLPVLSTLAPADKAPVANVFASVHDAAAFVLIALLGLHVAAALFHHFVRRDGVLTGMLPVPSAKSARPR